MERTRPQSTSERYWAQMLLRQHPWLKERLRGEEFPLAFSHRKPENLFGLSLCFIGAFILLDTLFHLAALGSVLIGIPAALAGAALLYGGLWSLLFAKRSYVLVTSERLVYQKTNLAGRPGKALSFPRSEIERVRFLKSTVMYRVGRSDGAIAVKLKSGKTIVLPSVLSAEDILQAFH